MINKDDSFPASDRSTAAVNPQKPDWNDPSQYSAKQTNLCTGLTLSLEALDSQQDSTATSPELSFPYTLGDYSLLEVAGKGGMGVVYRALQLDPIRTVALKVLKASIRADPRSRARVRHEIQVASALHHTHILPVLASISIPEGPVAYTMPFIRGHSLSSIIRDVREGSASGALDSDLASIIKLYRESPYRYYETVTEWIRQVAEALAAAHAAGVIHRDVKPGNILLEFDRNNRPHSWLHDFGLAYQENVPDPLENHKMFGTPGYMSPEQENVYEACRNPQTDVYSLGVTLWELLTLKSALVEKLALEGTKLPDDLKRIIKCATANNPNDRYPLATDLADDLNRFLTGYPVHAGRPGRTRNAQKWFLRHRRPIIAATSVLVLSSSIASAMLTKAYIAERDARKTASEEEKRAVEAFQTIAAYTLIVDDELYAIPKMAERQCKLLERNRAILVPYLEQKPHDWRVWNQLANTNWRLARAYLSSTRVQEPVEKALKLTLESIEGYRTVASSDPGNPLHRLDIARSQNLLATIYSRLGDLDQAEIADRQALQTVQRLLNDFPRDFRVQDAVSTYTSALGRRLLANGRYSEAEQAFRAAIAVSDQCIRNNPSNWQYLSAKMHAAANLSHSLAEQNRWDEAFQALDQATHLCEELLLIVRNPSTDSGLLDLKDFKIHYTRLSYYRVLWSLSIGKSFESEIIDLEANISQLQKDLHSPFGEVDLTFMRSWTAHRSNRPSQACLYAKQYEQLLFDLEKKKPSAEIRITLSRFYADGPGEKCANKAVEYAQAAEAIAPRSPTSQAALGIALFRAGKLTEADDLLASLGRKAPHRSVYLIRAAIVAGQGKRSEAIRLYETAKSATLPTEPCHFDLERELESLLMTLN